jgi:hypothetical protein
MSADELCMTQCCTSFSEHGVLEAHLDLVPVRYISVAGSMLIFASYIEYDVPVLFLYSSFRAHDS